MKFSWITNYLAVNEDRATKLADLDFAPEESFNSGVDLGVLYAAPIAKTSGTKWKLSDGTLAIYAATNADSILLGHMLATEVVWCDGDSDFDPFEMWKTLRIATGWTDTDLGRVS
ncbi:hypothetical protein [Tunturiibacter lichenicola]|uniref:hypothetical protein n=1 Tax=Tunturiibacter lichenicola TaxID=2051959 RepID=UPI003D9B3B80